MALKSGQTDQPVDIEELLDHVEKTLDRLKTLYEQYFLGMQKQPPSHIHTDVERRLRDLMQITIRNTGLRYRFATLQQKFGSYNNYWRRTLRQIENGTYLRQLSKISRQAALTGEEVPEEILAAMPKRMREQVKRDREAALALAARRKGEVQGADDEFLQEDAPGSMTPPVATAKTREPHKGAHVLSEDDFDLDMDSFFSAIEAGETPAEAAAKSGGRPSHPAMPGPSATGPQPAIPTSSQTGPQPAIRSQPSASSTGPRPVVPAASQTGPQPVVPSASQTGPQPAIPSSSTTGPRPAIPSASQTGPQPAIRPSQPSASATGSQPVVPGPGARPSQPVMPNLSGPRPAGSNPSATEPQPAIPGPAARPSQPAIPGSIPRPPGSIPAIPGPSATGPRPAVPSVPAVPSGVPARPSSPPASARPPGAPPAATKPPGQAGPPLRPPPGMNDADVNALYAKYVKAKEAVGETAGPGAYSTLMKTINAQAPKIMEQYKAKGVEFSVVVKDNQVVIKAKPKT